jgi:hypothetical protein
MTKPIHKSNAPNWEKFAAEGSEASHQILLFNWAASTEVRQLYPDVQWLFHIPNGGSRNKAEAGKLRAMGTKRGIPDICLPIQRSEYSGLWIELKKPASHGNAKEGNITPEQRSWIDHLKNQGYGVAVCVGWEAARDCIVSYLNYNGSDK